jgi:hypothetical protein
LNVELETHSQPETIRQEEPRELRRSRRKKTATFERHLKDNR